MADMDAPQTQRTVKVTGRTRDLVILVDRGVYALTHHWVAFVNALLLLYLAPAFAAPMLLASGHETASRVIYTLYGPPVCHQLPERSFFLYGPRPAYTFDELTAAGVQLSPNTLERRRFVGDAELGFKLALCQRDIALYGGMFFFGVLFALLARKWLKPLPWWGLALFALPLAADGFTQLFGLRESTPELRVVTGLLLSAGGVWFAYPYVEATMQDLRRSVATKLHLPL
jgi:uncharacterized membrane protein